MATSKQWAKLLLGIAGIDRAATKDVPRVQIGSNPDAPVLLDVSIASDNTGDEIIMDACKGIYRSIFPDVQDIPAIPTHVYSEDSEFLDDRCKILCGTNIIYTNMDHQQQWSLPRNLKSYKNTCLLGVGMSDIGIDDEFTPYTKRLFKLLFRNGYLHSTRDELTRLRLSEAGITNVVNTACPTMWSLTAEVQKKIPAKKSQKVLTSLTDYAFDPIKDKEMLGLLKQEYEEVVVWIQGDHDLDICLEQIADPSEFRLIGPNLCDLNEFIQMEDFDYVGTRLHAGIKCLNASKRSMIISVDNRARQIGKDTNLPITERSSDRFQELLTSWINGKASTEIILPEKDIKEWKAQFK